MVKPGIPVKLLMALLVSAYIEYTEYTSTLVSIMYGPHTVSELDPRLVLAHVSVKPRHGYLLVHCTAYEKYIMPVVWYTGDVI